MGGATREKEGTGRGGACCEGGGADGKARALEGEGQSQ